MNDSAFDLQPLLATLPVAAGIPTTSARSDVDFPATGENPSFVAPRLRARADIPNRQSPRVLIISAAGAVGKSTLARELAAARRAPFWDLSKGRTVGHGSLSGMISQAFGLPGAAQVHAAMQGGAFLLVIDALDEARVQVTAQAFSDFLDDVAQFAAQGTKACVVLLGRTQVAENAWLALTDKVPTSIYTIEPFSREQSHRYIDLHIRAKYPKAATQMERFAQPFASARDALLDALAAAVRRSHDNDQDEADTQAFVGYAPVLDALAVLLAEDQNWGALKDTIAMSARSASSAEAALRPAAFLRDVVQGVLKREQAKLATNVKQALQPVADQHGWSQWQNLYTPTEQCSRILSVVLGTVMQEPRGEVPSGIRGDYERQLAPFLGEHAFLRDGTSFANTVFESYVFATALADDKYFAYRQEVEARLSSPAHLPSRLLAEFYLLAASRQGPRSMPFVRAEHIGFLYDSIMSGETDNTRIDLSLESDVDTADSAIDADGEFAFYASGVEPQEEHSLDFTTFIKPEFEIVFSRYVKNTLLVAPARVRLGSGGDEFEVGPRVHIDCRHLTISARGLVVVGGTSSAQEADDAVMLVARDSNVEAVSSIVKRGPLVVSWPKSKVHPWTPHHVGLTDHYLNETPLAEAYRRFRRIVMTLRSHKKGNLARYRGKIEHQRVLKGELGTQLLERLRSDGVLRLDGNFYYWVPDAATAHVGISYQQLRDGTITERLTSYLEKFVRKPAS